MFKRLRASLVAVAILMSGGLTAAGPQEQKLSLPGYPAIGSPATVTLAAPGAEPRTRLRYKAAAGLKETMLMSTSMALNMAMEGMSMPMELPIMKTTADLAVTAVSPNGEITYDIAFTGMTAEAAPGMDPAMAAMAQGAAQGITALKGTATITDRGFNKSTALNLDKITDPTLKQLLGAMSSSIESMSMPLPDEAVGVGAKWEVRQAVTTAGATTFQRIECELMAIDAQGATIKTRAEQTVPAQSIANPALPGATVSVEKGFGSSTGSIMLRSGSLVPTSDTSGTTTMAMSLDMGGQMQKMAVETKIKISIAPKKN
jgi:hypothetical protein